MGKAEDRARDLGYWADPLNRVEYTANDELEAFIDGYTQAEKDFELSWEDIKLIDSLIDDVALEETDTMEDLYQEVLKRFNKERKEQ